MNTRRRGGCFHVLSRVAHSGHARMLDAHKQALRLYSKATKATISNYVFYHGFMTRLRHATCLY
jgi:hypothetical protein